MVPQALRCWRGRLWVRFRSRTHKVADGNPPPCALQLPWARGTSSAHGKLLGGCSWKARAREGLPTHRAPPVGAQGEVTAPAPFWGAWGWVLAVGACPGRSPVLLPGGCWGFVAPGSPCAACQQVGAGSSPALCPSSSPLLDQIKAWCSAPPAPRALSIPAAPRDSPRRLPQARLAPQTMAGQGQETPPAPISPHGASSPFCFRHNPGACRSPISLPPGPTLVGGML